MSWLARRNASRVQAGETGRDRAPIGLAQSRKPREGSWTWTLGRKPRSNILLLLSCEPNFASELLWLRPCNRTAIKRYGPLCLILLQFPYLRRSTVAPWNTFQIALQGAQRRRLMFVDLVIRAARTTRGLSTMRPTPKSSSFRRPMPRRYRGSSNSWNTGRSPMRSLKGWSPRRVEPVSASVAEKTKILALAASLTSRALYAPPE